MFVVTRDGSDSEFDHESDKDEEEQEKKSSLSLKPLPLDEVLPIPKKRALQRGGMGAGDKTTLERKRKKRRTRSCLEDDSVTSQTTSLGTDPSYAAIRNALPVSHSPPPRSVPPSDEKEEDDVNYIPLDDLAKQLEDSSGKTAGETLRPDQHDEDAEAKERGVDFCFLCYTVRVNSSALQTNAYIDRLVRMMNSNLGHMHLDYLCCLMQRYYNREIRDHIEEFSWSDTVWRKDVIRQHITTHCPTPLSDAMIAAQRVRTMMNVVADTVVISDRESGLKQLDHSNVNMLLKLMDKHQKLSNVVSSLSGRGLSKTKGK